MNKIIKSIIKNIPGSKVDIKKKYKKSRILFNATHFHLLKPLYKIWNYKIEIDNQSIPVRLFYPKRLGIYKVIIYYHGGGFVNGGINSYSKTCSTIAKMTNHLVVAIDYRLAPENPFPAGFNDCYAITKAIFLNPELFYITNKDITIMGDSAGGNIAASISLKARDTKDFKINKQILIYPALNNKYDNTSPFKSVDDYKNIAFLGAQRMNDYIDLYKNNDQDLINPYFCPLASKSFKKLPNTLIFTAELDILRDEGEYFAKILKNAGNKVKLVRVPEVSHGYFSFPYSFPSVKLTYKIINQFLKED
ncbi:MAG: alpha/beta hydrolase [Bacilli bacterium]